MARFKTGQWPQTSHWESRLLAPDTAGSKPVAAQQQRWHHRRQEHKEPPSSTLNFARAATHCSAAARAPEKGICWNTWCAAQGPTACPSDRNYPLHLFRLHPEINCGGVACMVERVPSSLQKKRKYQAWLAETKSVPKMETPTKGPASQAGGHTSPRSLGQATGHCSETSRSLPGL